MADLLERLFHLKHSGTTVRTELLAGLTTFMTMAYIIFVNPSMLSQAGMDHGAVFVATCLAAAIGCLVMGFFANYPVALAPGMGLNAFFAFTVVGQMGYSWQTALGAVFISGTIFFLLSVFKIREMIIRSIPLALRSGIAAGIGLFLGFIALRNAGIVVDNEATLVTMGDLAAWPPIMTIFGFVLITALYQKQVVGSVLIGVLSITLLSLLVGEVEWQGVFAPPPSIAPTFLQLDIRGALDVGMASVIFSLLFVDLFDTSGTLLAVAQKGKLFNKEGNLPRMGRALMADGTASVFSSLLGTSNTTSYVESCAGIAVGGKTGLTAVVVAILFLLALFFAPLAGTVPAYATAPALLFVAVLMTHSIVHIDWHDMTEAAPVIIAAITMPLTFSVTTGIALGFITYTAIKLVSGRWELLSPMLIALSVLFVVKLFIFP
ncbi:NCS2 family permease [Biformimicrobium ophioploci]|uniref:Solute carrier family 23 protein n=1 Tax=Biformimicrobium ophioploci TaxID=3036711 RepID=A0ABQ6LYJ2_9GAMM|nr:NCS2 family permease [Microbulbifer sp. NKW57]GMG87110.1 solute carrier family 23 protein [Microbulbifer sp. NKW57]